MQTLDTPTTSGAQPTGRPRRAWWTPSRVALGAVAAATIVSAGIAAATSQDSSRPQTVGIVADDDGMTVSAASVGRGFTRFEITNESSNEHNFAVARLEHGTTLDEVPALLSSPDFAAVVDAVDFYGGVNAVAAGATYTMTVELAAGQYVLVDYGEGPDGPWFLHDGFVRPLEVTGHKSPGGRPDANVQIVESDHAFAIPAELPRHAVWEIANRGRQDHEFDLLQLDPGVTPAQALQRILASDGDDVPGREVNVLGGLSTRRTAYVEMSLEPGQYLAVCFYPDVERDGIPHLMEGMSAGFTVA